MLQELGESRVQEQPSPRRQKDSMNANAEIKMPSDSKSSITFIVVFIVVALIIGLLVTSLKKLASNEVGIQYDTIQRNLGEKVFTEGLHFGPPGYKFIIFPNVYTTLDYKRLLCLNSDGVPIRIDASFQFKPLMNKIKAIILDLRDFENYRVVLTYTGEALIHEACSQFNTSQFQAERGNFQSTLSNIFKERFLKMHADVSDLQVNNIERPLDYESAIRSKERAREDIEVAKQERPRQITEAETKRREAESESQIITNKAKSDARILQNKATVEAAAIITQYEKEGEAYESIVSAAGLQFTPEGFISYLGTRVIAAAKNPVYVGLQSPAKTVYTIP